jgi:hypothetical protein
MAQISVTPASVHATTGTNLDGLLRLREWFLHDDSIFAGISWHGNNCWTAECLTWMGLFWSWSEARCLTDAFGDTRRWTETAFGTTPLTTYQGFMGALVTASPLLLPRLRLLLQQRMAQLSRKHWRIDGWLPLAFDGSRSSAPRTQDNEDVLCAPNYGEGTTAKYRKKKSKGMRRQQNEKNKPQPPKPQAWITLQWHCVYRGPGVWGHPTPANAPTSWTWWRRRLSRLKHYFAVMPASSASRCGRSCSNAGIIFWCASGRTSTC